MIALLRTEFVKATVRVRTLVMLAAMVGLPIVISLALHARARRRPDRGEGLFLLARSTGLVVPAAILSMMSAFLLVVVAGTIAGDAIAGDASSGNLRYLLLRPVSRTKVLVAKACVAYGLIWAATIAVATAGLVAGVILFGSHPLDVPATSLIGGVLSGGFHLTTGALLWRDAVATAYVAFGFSALLAIGMVFSATTDTPASAVSITVGCYIVSEILDAITDLGRIRYALPTHYQSAWESIITTNVFKHDLIVGIVVQLAYVAVFGAIAIWWFRRKDIRS
jgi:ABC-2 type transport system permease protein